MDGPAVLILVIANLLPCRVGSFDLRLTADVVPFALGGALTGLSLEYTFGRVGDGEATTGRVPAGGVEGGNRNRAG